MSCKTLYPGKGWPLWVCNREMEEQSHSPRVKTLCSWEWLEWPVPTKVTIVYTYNALQLLWGKEKKTGTHRWRECATLPGPLHGELQPGCVKASPLILLDEPKHLSCSCYLQTISICCNLFFYVVAQNRHPAPSPRTGDEEFPLTASVRCPQSALAGCMHSPIWCHL